jgi:hypothetical protein
MLCKLSFWTSSLSSAMPLALVEAKPSFNKNPRLTTVVGFLFKPRTLTGQKTAKT